MTNAKIQDQGDDYDHDGCFVLLASQVEVCEKQEHEVIVGADQASPSRYMLT